MHFYIKYFSIDFLSFFIGIIYRRKLSSRVLMAAVNKKHRVEKRNQDFKNVQYFPHKINNIFANMSFQLVDWLDIFDRLVFD